MSDGYGIIEWGHWADVMSGLDGRDGKKGVGMNLGNEEQRKIEKRA